MHWHVYYQCTAKLLGVHYGDIECALKIDDVCHSTTTVRPALCPLKAGGVGTLDGGDAERVATRAGDVEVKVEGGGALTDRPSCYLRAQDS